jgi:pimeloyl-ACP methyl ester carboxylesterase
VRSAAARAGGGRRLPRRGRPYPAEGLDWLDGTGEDNVQEFSAALAGRNELEPFLSTMTDEMLAAEPNRLADALKTLCSPVDAAVITGEYAEHLVTVVRRGIGEGVEGWIDDDFAFVSPWGFELGDIRVPVQLWHGAEDRFVPIAHGRWLAGRIPGVEVHLLERDGHMTIQLGRIGDVHTWLLEHF